jgi:nucleotide-binding universal stress UspA family protein
MKILALLTGTECTPACLDAAITAAVADPRARIAALHITIEPDSLIATDDEVALQRLREPHEGSAQARAEAARRAFVAWNLGLDDRAPRVEWHECMTGGVLDHTGDADLIVLARGQDLDSLDARAAALHDSGKPVLLVPADWHRPAGGFRHVAVGLSDSAVARGAITEALPWLKAAEQVTALRIGKPGDPAITMMAELRDLGLDPTLHVAPPSSDAVGTQIAQEAAALGADLLVAGAYRHGRLTEWLLGGTTRHLIAASSIALLLAHQRPA